MPPPPASAQAKAGRPAVGISPAARPGEKREWYRQYGVREYWLVDLHDDSVTIVDFTASLPTMRYARGVDTIESAVLPDLELSAFGLFTS